MKILKICTSIWHNASRDRRELSVCRELGMDTVVMAKGEPGDSFKKDEVDGFEVYRFSTRPLGTARCLNTPNRLLSLLIWGWKAKKFDADIISGHDITGLTIGWLSNIGKKHKAKLVYDSHEFELGRNAKRSKLTLLGIKWLEGFLMRRCAFSIMVNDSIADEVQRIHGLKERPVVVRNIANYWHLDETAIAEQRKRFCDALNVATSAFLVMYHGAVFPGRGIENMLRAIAELDEVFGLILGNGEYSYLGKLRDICKDLNIEKRILFIDAVPYSNLPNFVAASDVGMVILEKLNPNHYYTLPNKLFENVQAEVPIIVSDYPEAGGVVRKYGIGVTVDPENVEDIAAAIARLHDDKKIYKQYKENLSKAKEELCWEKEKERLKEAYGKLLH